MAKTVDLAIGEEVFKVGPMNLGQLEDAWPLAMTISGSGRQSDDLLKLLIDFLAIAIREDHPEVEVRKLKGSFADLQTAFTEVLGVSGFKTVAPSGEALAPVDSTPDGSSAPLPLAAATSPASAAA